MTCNGICSKYQVKKHSPRNGGNYEVGHKRCSFCEVYIICEERNCPCCGTPLRSKPRNNQARKKVIQKMAGQKDHD